MQVRDPPERDGRLDDGERELAAHKLHTQELRFDTALRYMSQGLLMVDREGNRGANLILCETEDDLQRVDAALNEVTPAAGRGARTSVEMYEVAFDERPGG